MARTVRIGCGAGFWGDTPEGPAQLVRGGGIDYLVMDYLAEITMSILARMKAKRPDLGYATDFVTMVMKPLAREIAQKKIRVVTNAGGVNPDACREALLAVFREAGVDLKVAVVRGDDLSGRVERYRAQDLREMFSGAPMPAQAASVNAYLGAFPIAAALDAGADVVITGRVVDSAVVLGPLIHEFGWQPGQHDLLSAGSLCGHVLECGTQVTGGIFTDWREVAGWDDMGFPVAECSADGSFVVTKPAGTGGLVSTKTVAEQIVYEVGDPRRYVLPDVVADWSAVRLEQEGPDRVRVTGARGSAPTDSYKVSLTHPDGYRSAVTMMIAGREAADKARATARAILARCERLMQAAGFDGFADRSIEVLGSEASYGDHARAGATREVILKIAVRHASKDALQIFGREIFPAATAMAQGLTGFAGGRPEPQPVIRLFSFLAPKADIPAQVEVDGRTIEVGPAILPPPPREEDGYRISIAPAPSTTSWSPSPAPQGRISAAASISSPAERGRGTTRSVVEGAHGDPLQSPSHEGAAESGTSQLFDPTDDEAPAPPSPSSGAGEGGSSIASPGGPLATVPLIALAHGRSGDKGDIGNVGILARRPEFLPWIGRSCTPEAVRRYFAHYVRGEVERFDWPGLNGLNFLLHQGLGGGGIASLRHDPQGKALAQIMMDFPVEVPAAWVADGGPLAGHGGEATS
ncbi:acyclic terpene utilization AtuA family protein [Aquibium microcysteis]|uniref:acyclic terpene utilization AtuA family protein n=1 Tax=Aquibium microcysteis TaxID=675281 RepID=UPI001AED76A2|nr:acyclic terpene utilization AtuA family protein [Aquibium microcysteis]